VELGQPRLEGLSHRGHLLREHRLEGVVAPLLLAPQLERPRARLRLALGPLPRLRLRKQLLPQRRRRLLPLPYPRLRPALRAIQLLLQPCRRLARARGRLAQSGHLG